MDLLAQALMWKVCRAHTPEELGQASWVICSLAAGLAPRVAGLFGLPLWRLLLHSMQGGQKGEHLEQRADTGAVLSGLGTQW